MTHSSTTLCHQRGSLLLAEKPREVQKLAWVTHRALHVPEIVELFLAYLVNPSELFVPTPDKDANQYGRPLMFRTLQWTWWHPLLVCRQWLEIGQRLRVRATTWYIKSTVEERGYLHSSFPVDLSRSRRLRIKATPGGDDEGEECRVGEEDVSRISWKHLRELVVQGTMEPFILDTLLTVRACAQHLTTIRIDPEKVTRFDLIRLLAGNPEQEGSVTNTPNRDSRTLSRPLSNPLRHLRHLSLSRVYVRIPEGWTLGYPSTIEELRLSVIFIHEPGLFRLLSALCGPRLQALHVVSWAGHAPPAATPLGLSVESLQHLSSLSPNIRSLTMGRAKPSMPNLQKLIALFQQVECVRLCRHTDSITARLKIVPGPSPGVLSSEDACIQTTPAPAQPLKEGGRFMTHLHIDGMHLMKSDPEFMLSFSAFLCSDAAMHLEELVAPKVEYTTTTFIEVDHIEQHMWTCRNLKVLALSFGTETQADRNDWYPARTMLAFIVVNCPRLRYLEISRHVFNMSVRCGVCFLSRLEHLEQLVITTSQFTSWGGHQGSVKLARWMRVKPTLVDMVLGQSSLVLCRRIAKLDDEMGYFGLPEGRRMLWPPKTYRSAARRKDPIATASASEGACWRRLRSIRIQITGVVKDDMKVKAEQEVALMRKAFPGIEYSLCYGENI